MSRLEKRSEAAKQRMSELRAMRRSKIGGGLLSTIVETPVPLADEAVVKRQKMIKGSDEAREFMRALRERRGAKKNVETAVPPPPVTKTRRVVGSGTSSNDITDEELLSIFGRR